MTACSNVQLFGSIKISDLSNLVVTHRQGCGRVRRYHPFNTLSRKQAFSFIFIDFHRFLLSTISHWSPQIVQEHLAGTSTPIFLKLLNVKNCTAAEKNLCNVMLSHSVPAVSISHNTQRTYKLKIKTSSTLTCSLEDGNLCGSMVRLFKSSDMVCKWVISPSIDISSSWKDKRRSLIAVLKIGPTT